MRSNKKTHSSKLNIFLVIAALLAVVISAITVSYSWIESANSLNVSNNSGAAENKISVNVSNPGVVKIDSSKSNSVSINDYIDNSNSLFLAPAKIDTDGVFKIKRPGTDNYTAATTNDIGNNYIEFDVPIQVVDPMLVFKVKGSVTNGNSIKTAYYLDKTFSNTVAASEIKADVAEPVAFSASRGEHTLKVRLWNDADTTGYDLLSGEVTFDLTLVPETPGTQNITLEESKYANVIATYNEAGEDKQILEGQSANVMTGTVITVKAETGLGKLITSGTNMILNGHQFASYSVTEGTMTEPTHSDSGNIRTTTSTYTVGTSDATITTNTSTDTFRLGGENIDGINKWSDSVHDSKDMEYNNDLNCVYLVIKATATPTFKIASGQNFSKTYRDSPDYAPSITMPSSNIIASGVNGAQIATPKDDKDKSFKYTAPINQDILVIYYLDSNEVEMTTDTELKPHYTATAKVSTTNSHGSAQVSLYKADGSYTDGDWAESVQVSRRATGDAKKVTFKATANAGYTFVGWTKNANGTGTVESTDLKYTTTLTGDLILYANFKQSHTVLVKAADGATLTATYTDISGTSKTAENITADTTINALDGTDVIITATPTDATGKYLFTWTDSSNAGSQDPSISTFASTSKYTINGIADYAEISVSLEHYYELKVNLEGTGSYSINSGTDKTELSTTYIKANESPTITAKRSGTDPYKVSWTASVSQTNSQSANLIGDISTDDYTVSNISADTTVNLKFERLYTVTYDSEKISITSPDPAFTDTSSTEYIAYYVSGTNNITFTSSGETEGKQYSYAWSANYEHGGNASGSNSTFDLTSPNGLTDNVKVTLTRTEIQGRTIILKNSAHAQVVATYGDTTTVLSAGANNNIPIGSKIYMTVKTADGVIKSSNNTNLINGHKLDGIYVTVDSTESKLTTSTSTDTRTQSNSSGTNIATTKIKIDSNDYYTVPTGTSDITIETKTIEEQYFICGEKFNNYSGKWTELAPMTRVTGSSENIVSAEITANSSDNDLMFKIAIKNTEDTTSTARKDSWQYCVNYSSPGVSGGDGENLLQITNNKYVNLYFKATANKVYTVEYNIDTNTVTVKPKEETPPTGITVYFEDTLNWGQAYVYFYRNAYWNDNQGTGSSNASQYFIGGPYPMTRITGTNIYQFTYSGEYSGYVSFTKDKQEDYGNFSGTQAVYRGDFNSTNPLFIPDTKSTRTLNSNVPYYNNGVWSAYPNTTVESDYYLRGKFNEWKDSNKMVKPSSGSNLVETTISVGAGTYEFKINNGSTWYTYADVTITNSSNNTYIDFSNTAGNAGDCKIKVDSAGKYKFIFNTSEKRLTVVKIPD